MKSNKFAPRNGRSIEEVMVRRKLDGTDPTSWPNITSRNNITKNTSHSNTSSNLNRKMHEDIIELSSSMPELSALIENRTNKKLLSSSSNNSSLKLKNVINKTTAAPLMDSTTKDETIERLADYCRTLQKRINVLESTSSQRVVSTAPSTDAISLQNTLLNSGYGNNNIKSNNMMTRPSTMNAAIGGQYQRIGTGSGKRVRISDELIMNKTTPIPNSHNKSSGILRPSTTSSSLSLNNSQKDLGKEKLRATTAETLTGFRTGVTKIDSRLTNLREMFRDIDPMEERSNAITHINRIIRGWLVRVRLGHYHAGLRDWRYTRSRQVVWILEMMLGSQGALDVGFQQMIMRREMRSKYSVFNKWWIISRQSAPLRRDIRRRAEEKFIAKLSFSKQKYFTLLKRCTIGSDSRKQAALERRELVNNIRNEMSEKFISLGEPGIVTEHELKLAVERRVCMQFLKTTELRRKKMVYNGFCKLIRMAKNNLLLAKKHNYNHLAGMCFYAWTEHVYLVAAGLDRKRWPGPRRYEVRYNTKRIRNFERIRQIKYVWGPLKEFFIVQSNVRKAYRRQLARFIKNNFIAWRKTAIDSKRLRKVTIDNWKSYSRLMVTKPFHAWAGYVSGAKHKMYEHERLAQAHIRCKQRIKLNEIMKRWRHQAKFGRIDGLYTRKMLIDSLGEQKNVSRRLEKMMGAQLIELEECREKLEKECKIRGDLENKLQDASDSISKLMMISHHGDQERKRLESIIESMAIINPVQIKHLQQYQYNFGFKLRRIPETKIDNKIDNDENEKSTLDGTNSSLIDEIGKDDDANNQENDEDGNDKDDDDDLNDNDENNNEINIKEEEEEEEEKPTLTKDITTNILHATELDHDDKLLLLRVKWLLARFHYDHNIEGHDTGSIGEKGAIVHGGIPKALSYNEKNAIKNELKIADTALMNEGSNSIANNTTSDTSAGVNHIHSIDENIKIDEENENQNKDETQNEDTNSIISALDDFSIEQHLHKGLDDTSAHVELKYDNQEKYHLALLIMSLIKFLKDGDTTSFMDEDIRDWTESVMNNVISRDHDSETAFLLGLNDDSKPHEIKEATQHAAISIHMAPHSWRNVLVYLRTKLPAPGILEPNDHESKLFSRFHQMRQDLDQILIRYSDKYMDGLPTKNIDNYTKALYLNGKNNEVMDDKSDNNINNIQQDGKGITLINNSNNDINNNKVNKVDIYAANLPKQLDHLN